jgi:uroporphyrinogen decarboxylase
VNSRQRVMATVAGEPTDRTAFTAMLSLYGAALTDCPLKQYYTCAESYVAGQAAVIETFAPDVVFTPFACPVDGEAFGAKAAFFDNQPPNIIRPAISSIQEIASLPTPDIETHPRLMYIREALRAMVSAYGQERAIVGIATNPVDLPFLIMGIGGWMETVLFDLQGARRMLDVTIPFFVRWINSLLADGADLVALSTGMLNPSIVTREMAETFTRPALVEALAEINGPVILHHTGGSCLKNLDLFAGLPNVLGVVIDSCDDPGKARGILGPEMLLFSGPNGPDLPTCTADMVESECRDLLIDRQDDLKFILATSSADVPLATPVENIHAIRQAVIASAEEGR